MPEPEAPPPPPSPPPPVGGGGLAGAELAGGGLAGGGLEGGGLEGGGLEGGGALYWLLEGRFDRRSREPLPCECVTVSETDLAGVARTGAVVARLMTCATGAADAAWALLAAWRRRFGAAFAGGGGVGTRATPIALAAGAFTVWAGACRLVRSLAFVECSERKRCLCRRSQDESKRRRAPSAAAIELRARSA